MSFQTMKSVPGELLEERIETVKLLQEMETESYAVAKDTKTGEHYLHYRYIHRDIAAGGAESAYHQLMPLDSDDVLGILFSEQPYTYPDAWAKPYLRNGPDQDYIWFDPAPTLDEDDGEREAARIRETLLQFKKKGSFDAADVEKLFRELDDSGSSDT